MMDSAVQCVTRQDLSVTEKCYAVIEKEAHVTTWATERFSAYVLGIKDAAPYPSFPPETYEI